VAAGNVTDQAHSLARFEARLLLTWTLAELDKLKREEITEEEAADRIAAHAWSYRVGRVVAERTDAGS
jgi:hypothetical protein